VSLQGDAVDSVRCVWLLANTACERTLVARRTTAAPAAAAPANAAAAAAAARSAAKSAAKEAGAEASKQQEPVLVAR
jgi:hypothetical protein